MNEKITELNYRDLDFWTWLRYRIKRPNVAFVHELYSNPEFFNSQQISNKLTFKLVQSILSNLDNLDIVDTETFEVIYPVSKIKKYKKLYKDDYGLHNWIIYKYDQVKNIKEIKSKMRTYQLNYFDTPAHKLKNKVKNWRVYDGNEIEKHAD
ncbi:hypothetical protein HLA87_02520 [Mycoplasma miroungigenitalium]|uniref:Uncharacterized protein n=1 Tax=Mycoplasma miroungigenitalium TaxID=754515 RepID=A0A6M4JBK6_9MOLU|nr:hypothetical protein [Mycoplasma miroungigenitalium]QJR43648.1 hypothetical protein HLA87_02520 [Mycoplasma miroungigenitalium]